MAEKAHSVVLCTIGKMVYPDHLRDHPQDAQTYLALSRYLHRIYVLVASRDRQVHISHLGRVAVVCLPQGYGLLNYLLFGIAALRLGWRLYKRSGVNVYAASEPLIAGPIGLVLKWRTRRPLLVHLLGELLDLPVSDLHPCRAWAVKTISRFVCKKADRVRCVSRSIVESARKVGIPDKCLIYLPMRVDMSVFSRDRQQAAGLAIRQRFGLDNLPVILFLGTFSVHKGLTYLLRAMAQVSRGYPEARLLLVGSGPLEDELKALVNDLGLVQKVIFAGRITYDQVPAFLAASDLLVLPSLNEGLPRVVLEAMAMGLPVVASRVGGIPELVRDGETGLLVPPRNEEALGKALVSLLADPASRRAMGNHARQHVQSEYEFNINILQYASCIIKMAVC